MKEAEKVICNEILADLKNEVNGFAVSYSQFFVENATGEEVAEILAEIMGKDADACNGCRQGNGFAFDIFRANTELLAEAISRRHPESLVIGRCCCWEGGYELYVYKNGRPASPEHDFALVSLCRPVYDKDAQCYEWAYSIYSTVPDSYELAFCICEEYGAFPPEDVKRLAGLAMARLPQNLTV